MHYDSGCEYSRQHLAISIVSKLAEAGFEKVESNSSSKSFQTKEYLYERIIDGTDLKIQVYTTVIDDNNLGMIARSMGRDAIRVNVMAPPPIARVLITEPRVNRVGEIEDIVERMLDRARAAYKSGRKSGSCHQCGAPRALSKAGKWYCAKICWKSSEEKMRDKAEWQSKNIRSNSRYLKRF